MTGESNNDGDDGHDESSDPTFLEDFSRMATEHMLEIPGFLLDELIFTQQFCNTAVRYSEYAEMGIPYDEIIRNRYDGMMDRLKSDLNYAPIIIERLERMYREVMGAPDTKFFIEKHIESVRQFAAGLRRYADSIAGNGGKGIAANGNSP
jgi:hypothetical protein